MRFKSSDQKRENRGDSEKERRTKKNKHNGTPSLVASKKTKQETNERIREPTRKRETPARVEKKRHFTHQCFCPPTLRRPGRRRLRSKGEGRHLSCHRTRLKTKTREKKRKLEKKEQFHSPRTLTVQDTKKIMETAKRSHFFHFPHERNKWDANK